MPGNLPGLEGKSVYNFEKHAGPNDLAYHQPVRASRVEVSEDCLSFFKADARSQRFSTSQLFKVGAK
jgi:hypothetical protein